MTEPKLSSSRYRIGDATLLVETDQPEFGRRFHKNYAECALSEAPSDPPTVRFELVGAGNEVVARFDTPSEPLPKGFPLALLPLKEGEAIGPNAPGACELDHPVGRVTIDGDTIAVDADAPWPPLLSSVAVHLALAAQRGTIFFHGAAASVNGRGTLLLGDSGSGKTSLSLALAARGHGSFGDDIVGVRLDSTALVPVRRAAHLRRGPRAPEVSAALRAAGITHEDRQNVNIGELFPSAPAGEAKLDIVVRLRSFSETTRLEPFEPSVDAVDWITPHAGSLIADGAPSRIMRLISLISRSRCYFLDAASPEGAAKALEQIAG